MSSNYLILLKLLVRTSWFVCGEQESGGTLLSTNKLISLGSEVIDMHTRTYTLEEVGKVIETKPEELEKTAKEMHRTKAAVRLLQWQANTFHKGRENVGSPSLQKHFRTYFTNKGNLQLEKEEPRKLPVEKLEVSTKVDECKAHLEGLIEEAQTIFEKLQSTLSEIAQLSVRHQLHSKLDELEEMKEWKKETEKEYNDLKEFRDHARRNNLGSMLRAQSPF